MSETPVRIGVRARRSVGLLMFASPFVAYFCILWAEKGPASAVTSFVMAFGIVALMWVGLRLAMD